MPGDSRPESRTAERQRCGVGGWLCSLRSGTPVRVVSRPSLPVYSRPARLAHWHSRSLQFRPVPFVCFSQATQLEILDPRLWCAPWWRLWLEAGVGHWGGEKEVRFG